jgi:YolD-like protein
MSIHDRGNIKWTSLMLPEHVKLLRKYINEEYHEVPEPILDEQQLAEINTLILESMEFNFLLSFTIYKDKRLIVIQGNIHFIDENKQELRIMDLDNHLHIKEQQLNIFRDVIQPNLNFTSKENKKKEGRDFHLLLLRITYGLFLLSLYIQLLH